MSGPEVNRIAQIHGDVPTAISDGIVGLVREFYGKGPTRAKSFEVFILAQPISPTDRELPEDRPSLRA